VTNTGWARGYHWAAPNTSPKERERFALEFEKPGIGREPATPFLQMDALYKLSYPGERRPTLQAIDASDRDPGATVQALPWS
jgi:hypothetical protein